MGGGSVGESVRGVGMYVGVGGWECVLCGCVGGACVLCG